MVRERGVADEERDLEEWGAQDRGKRGHRAVLTCALRTRYRFIWEVAHWSMSVYVAIRLHRMQLTEARHHRTFFEESDRDPGHANSVLTLTGGREPA